MSVRTVAILLAAITFCSIPNKALSQASSAQQCAALSSLAEKHEAQALAHLKSMEADSKNADPAAVARIVEEKTKLVGSESEIASLAREAYRKCLIGYLQGGQAAQPAPAPVPATPPVQQAQPLQQQPVQQRPVQQAQPAKRRPVQQQQVYRQKVQPEQEYQPIFRPGGLIDLGIGIGLGRILRDR